jgi:hypothetical protein
MKWMRKQADREDFYYMMYKIKMSFGNPPPLFFPLLYIYNDSRFIGFDLFCSLKLRGHLFEENWKKKEERKEGREF